MKISRSQMRPFLLGFLIVVVGTIISSALPILYLKFLISSVDMYYFSQDSNTVLTQFVFYLFLVPSYVSVIWAGYIASKNAPANKKWKYGMIMGIILFVIANVLLLIPFLIPQEKLFGSNFTEAEIKNMISQRWWNFFKGLPTRALSSIGLATLGGVLAQQRMKRKK